MFKGSMFFVLFFLDYFYYFYSAKMPWIIIHLHLNNLNENK